jgi:phosphate transport system permease protein
MTTLKTVSTRKAKRRDKLARWVITLGGIAVIVSVIAILALIVGVTFPLFRSPRAEQICSCDLRSPLAVLHGTPTANGPHPDPLPKGEGTVSNSSPRLKGEGTVLRLGIDLDVAGKNATGIVWYENGTVAWLDLRTGERIGSERLTAPGRKPGDTLRHVESLGGGRYSLLWSDGAASLVEVAAGEKKRGDPRATRYSVRSPATMPVPSPNAKPRPVVADQDATSCRGLAEDGFVFIRRSDTGAVTLAARRSDGTIAIVRQVTTETPMGDEEVNTYRSVLRGDIIGHIRAMNMDREGTTLYAGTDDGRLVRWRLDDKGEAADREVVRAFGDRRPITALALVLGDVSLAVGDAKGGLTVWSPVKADGTRKLQKVHELQPHDSPIREILASGRNKSILSLDDDGMVHLDHVTSERRLLSLSLREAGGTASAQVAFGSRGDAILGLVCGKGDRHLLCEAPEGPFRQKVPVTFSAGRLTAWRIEGGCPEVSWKTLFGKVHYEGYDAPECAWQTTGGEDFEAKLSLVPLMLGTLKGTFYAMLFAVPLALFAAMYVSYFTTPWFRRTVKPVIEIMASVPSVVIGFLIALWLAPRIERGLLTLFTSLVTIPLTFVVFMALWQLLRRMDWARRVENGYEFLVVLPVLLLGVGIAICLATPLEAWLFEGNFRRWLFAGPLHAQYDQRNCIIITFGLGFTVIPIIFSIAEDSLSNVPYNMTAASMAVGASRWQTLWRVVLPSASPGIFAATMIGFGRAVGETMIVLMATGNTPILSWSPFNGMRTLSANIAVEIPEAPVGGTLYRVLFLCAVLLFVLTFTVNTAAELVRQRLRKRFGKF